MKRLVLCFMLIVMALGCTVCAAEPEPIRIIINGQELVCPDSPVEADNTVLVPIRQVFEAFSKSVSWDGERMMVEVTANSGSLLLRIGSTLVLQNNSTTFLMDTPPRLVGGSTMVPISFVQSSLGVNINWMKSDRTVVIVTAG